MEVCSGSGDWVVDKASKDPNVNWVHKQLVLFTFKVAIEIRQERCYQIWTQSMMKQLNNLLVLCGDGHVILEEHIEADSLEEVI